MKKSFTAKLWTVMRICAAQGIIAITLCGVTLAHPNYAQLLDKEISIIVTDLPFEKALNEIEQVAKVKFGYSINQFQDEPNVSLSIEKKTLRDVLDELFVPRKIRYKVHEKEAAITLKKFTESEKEQSSIHEGSNGSTQHRTLIQVTGIVTEASTQTPMAGVNVIVKGTTSGTTTDAAGRYNVGAENNDVLIFSFIGYASLEIPVNGRTEIDVVMTEDVQSLSEVVVNAGYWEVKEREQTGNISRIASEVIEKQPVGNPLQAMQGRMTGVYIQQNTGVPGGGFNIQIRGQNSLRTGVGGTVNGNLPLYIVDGIPFTSTSLTSSFTSTSNLYGGNPLSAINPNDIESIEVLKDADATAIYGSRGANGVVLITTKKAREGKTSVDVNFYRGAGQVTHTIDLLNTTQYVEMRTEALKNDGYLSLLDDPQFDAYWPDLKAWDTTRYTNWQKKLIGGTANVTNAQLSVSGGNAHTQFLFGGGYYNESTVFPGDNAFQRGSGRFNINHLSSDGKFKATVSLNYTASLSNIPSIDFTAQAVTLPPNAPALYNSNGKLNWENGTWTNPLAFLTREYNSNIDNLVSNTSVRYEILKGLNLKASLGFTNMRVEESSINPLSAYNPDDLAGRTGSSSFADAKIKTWIVEPQADYTRKIAEGHLNVTIGTTFQESIQSGRTIEATGYTNDALLENIDAATDLNIISTSYSQYRYAAAFMRLNYNWQEKYIINLTGRRDGSSRFGEGNRFANFGAIGAAWIFSNENFLSTGLPLLSFGKLRASFGTTGSDAIGNYQYLDTYLPTTYPYNDTGGLVVARLNNPDYSWETNKKAEVGMDLGFMKDRIYLSAAFYLNRSSNQLVGLPLPVLTGQPSVQFNLPATVENRGWEFQVTSVNIRKDKFEWSTNFNISIPRNELIEFPGLEKFPAYMNKYDIGNSLFTYKALQYNGVDPQTGVYTFKDIDGDGNISSSLDLIGLEEITQQYYGGINNTFTFRGLQLDIFFQFVKQSGYNYMRSFTFPGDFSNQPDIVMNRWQQEGDDAGIQRFTVFDPDGSVSTAFSYSLFSNNVISDASFVRLKNVSISWQLPSSWMQKAKVKGFRVYVQGQNLITFTDYIGLDPENMTSQSLPPLRMVTAGFELTL